jgi:uncharacterized protein (TIGR02599 family)
MSSPASLSLARRGAFTIVELLAATAVFAGLMLMLVTATNQTGDMWRRSASKIEQFQQARRGFESMTRRISQATLNTYWDYHYPNNPKTGKPDRSQVPDGYVRQAELRFRSGQASTLLNLKDGITRPTHAVFFQAPLGFVDDDVVIRENPAQTHKPLNNLLNTWGFFLEVTDDKDIVPDFLRDIIPARTRSRLVEMMEPSETIKIDNPSQEVVENADGTKTVKSLDTNWDNPLWLGWFADPVKRRTPVRVLADNVLALVILPRLSPQDETARANAKPPKTNVLCPVYDYDSKRLANTAAAIANPANLNLKASDPELNPKNQLPPVVTVAMVAIDETSARRLSAQVGDDATLGLNMATLFKDSTKLEKSSDDSEGDLGKLQDMLQAKKLTYRVFTSNVAIRGAKWSRWQDN